MGSVTTRLAAQEAMASQMAELLARVQALEQECGSAGTPAAKAAAPAAAEAADDVQWTAPSPALWPAGLPQPLKLSSLLRSAASKPAAGAAKEAAPAGAAAAPSAPAAAASADAEAAALRQTVSLLTAKVATLEDRLLALQHRASPFAAASSASSGGAAPAATAGAAPSTPSAPSTPTAPLPSAQDPMQQSQRHEARLRELEAAVEDLRAATVGGSVASAGSAPVSRELRQRVDVLAAELNVVLEKLASPRVATPGGATGAGSAGAGVASPCGLTSEDSLASALFAVQNQQQVASAVAGLQVTLGNHAESISTLNADVASLHGSVASVQSVAADLREAVAELGARLSEAANAQAAATAAAAPTAAAAEDAEALSDDVADLRSRLSEMEQSVALRLHTWERQAEAQQHAEAGAHERLQLLATHMEDAQGELLALREKLDELLDAQAAAGGAADAAGAAGAPAVAELADRLAETEAEVGGRLEVLERQLADVQRGVQGSLAEAAAQRQRDANDPVGRLHSVEASLAARLQALADGVSGLQGEVQQLSQAQQRAEQAAAGAAADKAKQAPPSPSRETVTAARLAASEAGVAARLDAMAGDVAALQSAVEQLSQEARESQKQAQAWHREQAGLAGRLEAVEAGLAAQLQELADSVAVLQADLEKLSLEASNKAAPAPSSPARPDAATLGRLESVEVALTALAETVGSLQAGVDDLSQEHHEKQQQHHKGVPSTPASPSKEPVTAGRLRTVEAGLAARLQALADCVGSLQSVVEKLAQAQAEAAKTGAAAAAASPASPGRDAAAGGQRGSAQAAASPSAGGASPSPYAKLPVELAAAINADMASLREAVDDLEGRLFEARVEAQNAASDLGERIGSVEVLQAGSKLRAEQAEQTAAEALEKVGGGGLSHACALAHLCIFFACCAVLCDRYLWLDRNGDISARPRNVAANHRASFPRPPRLFVPSGGRGPRDRREVSSRPGGWRPRGLHGSGLAAACHGDGQREHHQRRGRNQVRPIIPSASYLVQ